MPLKEKGVGSSMSMVGGKSHLLGPDMETKLQNFPKVTLEVLAEAGRASDRV